MKVRIELAENLAENEILIRCGRVDESIRKIHKFILEQSGAGPQLTFYKQNREFYFPLDDILFFETTDERVFAHTAGDVYLIKHRLCELEQLLPRNFVRAAKSTIVNVCRVYSVTKNLTSSSLIQFADSHKQVYASRYYYRDLRQRLQEKSRFEK